MLNRLIIVFFVFLLFTSSIDIAPSQEPAQGDVGNPPSGGHEPAQGDVGNPPSGGHEPAQGAVGNQPSGNHAEKGHKNGGGNGINIDRLYDIKLKVLGEPVEVSRFDSIKITYNLSNPNKMTFNGLKFSHDIPKCFENLESFKCDISNHSLTFNCTLNASSSLYFGYNATIAKDAPIKKISLNDSKVNNAQIRIVQDNCEINISNNNPWISDAFIEIDGMRDFPYKNNTYIISKTNRVVFICIANDSEDRDDNLYYTWKSGEEQLVSGNNNSISWDTNYGKYQNITVIVEDKDRGTCIYDTGKTINVVYENSGEYFKAIFTLDNLLFLIGLYIFISMRKEYLAKGYIWIILIAFTILMYYVLYKLDEHVARTTGIIELFILIVTIIFTNKFIVSSFSDNGTQKTSHNKFLNFCKINTLNYRIQGLLKLKNINIINLVKIMAGIYQKEKKWYSWYTTTLAMSFIAIGSLIYNTPPTRLENSDLFFNFIFYYYTMMTQTFGAIVAIVAMVATSSIDIKRHNNLKRTKDELNIIENKIKNFMYLHVAIIILSIIGLALRALPPLQQYELIQPIQIIPLFIFEATLLLAVPALTCLVKFVLDYYNFRKNELLPYESDIWFFNK